MFGVYGPHIRQRGWRRERMKGARLIDDPKCVAGPKSCGINAAEFAGSATRLGNALHETSVGIEHAHTTTRRREKLRGDVSGTRYRGHAFQEIDRVDRETREWTHVDERRIALFCRCATDEQQRGESPTYQRHVNTIAAEGEHGAGSDDPDAARHWKLHSDGRGVQHSQRGLTMEIYAFRSWSATGASRGPGRVGLRFARRIRSHTRLSLSMLMDLTSTELADGDEFATKVRSSALPGGNQSTARVRRPTMSPVLAAAARIEPVAVLC